jgi:dolichyl-phosphate-mannose-protein mannosyltransferase
MKDTLTRLYRSQYFWLCLILIISLAAHFAIITIPNDLILDEQHYVKDARSIINTQTDQRPEHPPLAKLFIVGGIDAFGDNPWGWRIPSILMGTIGILLFYFICRRLGLSLWATNVATFLLAFENFSFVLNSVAMLDVFYVTLMFAFFLLYLYREYFLSGVFVGLSALGKLYAALGTPTLFIHWIFTRTRQSRWFILTIIGAPVSFLAFMPLFDWAISRHFESPISRVKDMLSLSGSLTFANTTHPALSRPWEWFLNYRPMAFWYIPHYTGAISPSIWGLMIPIVLYLIYRAVKKNEAGLFGFSWFLGTYLLWIPISIATDRISFIYYIYPTIGSLCLGLGMGLNEAREWVSLKPVKIKVPVMAGITAILLLHVASFIVLTPVFFRT